MKIQAMDIGELLYPLGLGNEPSDGWCNSMALSHTNAKQGGERDEMSGVIHSHIQISLKESVQSYPEQFLWEILPIWHTLGRYSM